MRLTSWLALLLATAQVGCGDAVADFPLNSNEGWEGGEAVAPFVCRIGSHERTLETDESFVVSRLVDNRGRRPLQIVRAPIPTRGALYVNRVKRRRLVIERRSRNSGVEDDEIAFPGDAQLLDASDEGALYARTDFDEPGKVDIYFRHYVRAGVDVWIASDTVAGFERFTDLLLDGAQLRLVHGDRAAYPGRAGLITYDGRVTRAHFYLGTPPSLPRVGSEMVVWTVGEPGARDIVMLRHDATSPVRLTETAVGRADDAAPMPIGDRLLSLRDGSLLEVEPEPDGGKRARIIHRGPCTPAHVDGERFVYACADDGVWTVYLSDGVAPPVPLHSTSNDVYAPRSSEDLVGWFEFPPYVGCPSSVSGTHVLAQLDPIANAIEYTWSREGFAPPCGSTWFRPPLEARLGPHGVGYLQREPDGPLDPLDREQVWRVSAEVWHRACYALP